MATSSTVKVTGNDIVMPPGKITSLTNGSAASDAAAFGQIPVIATTAPLAAGYPAAIGAVGRFADEAHQHETPDPNYDIDRLSDFCGFAPGATTYVDDGIEWTVTASGAGAAAALGAGNSATVIGTVSVSTGTTNTGSCGLTAWPNANDGLCFPFAAADAFSFSWIAKTPIVSDGTETHVFKVGVGNFVSGTPGAGIWFEWNANADTHILCKTATGSVTTTAVTSTVVAGTGYHRLQVRKAAGSSTITFAIDGVDVGTGTLPTGANIGPVAVIIKSAGTTARLAHVDLHRFRYRFAAARYT